MPTFRYDLAEMSDFVDLLDSSIDEIRAHCDDAKAAVASVLEHCSGAAATAFTQFHDGWQISAREHLDALMAYRNYVATARDNYAEARRKNLEMFG